MMTSINQLNAPSECLGPRLQDAMRAVLGLITEHKQDSNWVSLIFYEYLRVIKKIISCINHSILFKVSFVIYKFCLGFSIIKTQTLLLDCLPYLIIL